MARRLGDDALVLDACEVGFVSLWRPDTAELRLELASEAMDIASRIGNERAFVVAATLTAVAHGECGTRGRDVGEGRRGPWPRPSGCTCPTASWSWTRWSCPGS